MYSARKQYTSLTYRKKLHFLYTKMKYQKGNVKKKITFKITPPKIKYLGINLTKEVKDLNFENY